ncbi:MAG: hypothetical protein ACJAT4_000735 [Granulosicoccus sp.]|jgi:hypothetical protein
MVGECFLSKNAHVFVAKNNASFDYDGVKKEEREVKFFETSLIVHSSRVKVCLVST